MAGGIDWFRWHHGSVTDPKFQLVAKKAGASVAEVIAVWACLLEAASQSAERGNPGIPDFEAMDCALGMQDGRSAAIHARMCERELIGEDGTVTAWERRQPKREDETAAARKRQQRERDTTGTPRDEKRDTQPPNESDESRRVTSTTRDVTASHDRGEKSREEKKRNTNPPNPPAGGRVRSPSSDPEGFAEWWERYSRKDARADAVKAWRQLAPDAELQARMLAALRVWRWNEDRRLNPLPATWLRGKRWDDEVVAKALGQAAGRSAPWVAAAGFANVYEANNAGCYEHNAEQFEGGKRKEHLL